LIIIRQETFGYLVRRDRADEDGGSGAPPGGGGAACGRTGTASARRVGREAGAVFTRAVEPVAFEEEALSHLRRPFSSYWAMRYGADFRSPSAAIHGPKVMLINEQSGSGGPPPQDGVILQLQGNGVFQANHKIVDRQGTWSTGQTWGTGWSALLFAFDRSGNNWIVQIETPRTAE
jgi:hypothetical protein